MSDVSAGDTQICPHCQSPVQVAGSSFCMRCGSTLNATVFLPPIPKTARPITSADRRFTQMMALVSVIGGVAAGIPRVSSLYGIALLLLVGYAVVVPARTRNAVQSLLLCGGLGALLSVVVGIARAGGLHVAGSLALRIIVPPLALAVLGAVTALVAGWLVKPTRLSEFARYFSRIMATETFAALGLDQAALSALTHRVPADAPATSVFLDARDRLPALDAGLRALRDLDLPRIGVTRAEVAAHQASRPMSDASCLVCEGSGAVPCGSCAGSGLLAGTDTIDCATCGGTGESGCECVRKVTFAIPPGAASGFVLCAGDYQERAHYAVSESSSLARQSRPLLVLLVGILGIPVGLTLAIPSLLAAHHAAGIGLLFTLLWLALGGILLALAGVPVLLGKRAGFKAVGGALGAFAISAVISFCAISLIGLLQNGLPIGGILMQIPLAAIIGGIVILLVFWRSKSVMSFFGQRTRMNDLTAADLLPIRDRLAGSSGLRALRKAALVAWAVLALWLALDVVFGPYWTFARAGIAEETGGSLAASRLYQEAAHTAGSKGFRKRALLSSHRVMVREIEDTLVKAKDRRLLPWEADTVSDLCVSLGIEQAESLSPKVKARMPAMLIACAETMERCKLWDQARAVLNVLEDVHFHDSAEAVTERGRSEWRFVETGGVSTTSQVEVAYLSTEGIWGNYVVKYENRKAKADTTFVQVRVQMAHLGGAKEELRADYFTLRGADGRSRLSVGMQGAETDESMDTRGLRWSQELEPIGVGPDLLDTELVFEVPKSVKQFGLMLKGERVASVRVGSE